MVGGAHHDDRGHQRVDDAGHLRRPRAAVAPQHHPAPQRPAHVQARHRRVLVRHPAQAARRARLAAPPAVRAVVRHRVDEAVARVQQPGRAGGQQGEADETDERGGHQPGAGGPVAHGARAEDPDQEHRGDQVVQRRVPEVGRYADPGLTGEEAVERVLRVEEQRLLYAQDRQAVVDGVGDVAPYHEAAGGVAGVDEDDERQLGPPAQPSLRGRRDRLGARWLGVPQTDRPPPSSRLRLVGHGRATLRPVRARFTERPRP